MGDAAARARRVELGRYCILARPAGRRRRVALALELGDLTLDELKAVVLAADLDGQALGQRAAVAGDEGGKHGEAVGPARVGVVDAHGHEQTPNAGPVTGL